MCLNLTRPQTKLISFMSKRRYLRGCEVKERVYLLRRSWACWFGMKPRVTPGEQDSAQPSHTVPHISTSHPHPHQPLERLTVLMEHLHKAENNTAGVYEERCRERPVSPYSSLTVVQWVKWTDKHSLTKSGPQMVPSAAGMNLVSHRCPVLWHHNDLQMSWWA